MPTYDAVCENCGEIEIVKRMADPFPTKCLYCGGAITRRFHTHRVIYNAPGFFGYDHQMRRHMTPDRYAKFEKQRDEIRQNAVQDRSD